MESTFINAAIVAGVVIAAIIVYMLLDNRKQSERIIDDAFAMGGPSPGRRGHVKPNVPAATEHETADFGKVDAAVERMRRKLVAEVGEDGRIEFQTYLLLNGKAGIIGTGWKEGS